MRKKTKASPEGNDASYFLPEVEELESSECKPFKLADDWVTFAQDKMFPSALGMHAVLVVLEQLFIVIAQDPLLRL